MSSKQIGACLTNIESLQSVKDLPTQNEPGNNSSTTGKGQAVRTLVSLTGSQHGGVGYVKMSTGQMLTVPISKNRQGIAVAPQLTVRDWQLIDVENETQIYDNPRQFKITADFENRYAPVLVQAQAALKPAEFEQIITRLTRLKLQKPTQAMDEASVSVFLEDIAEQLEGKGYGYFAIDAGINKLLERESEKFFPTFKVLNGYIYSEHYQLKRRADRLETMLTRRHKDI